MWYRWDTYIECLFLVYDLGCDGRYDACVSAYGHAAGTSAAALVHLLLLHVHHTEKSAHHEQTCSV